MCHFYVERVNEVRQGFSSKALTRPRIIEDQGGLPQANPSFIL